MRALLATWSDLKELFERECDFSARKGWRLSDYVKHDYRCRIVRDLETSKIAGCAWYGLSNGRIEIASICVLREFRGRGYAHAMLCEVHENMSALGFKKAFLDVLASNTRARAVYESIGYRNVGRARNGVIRMQVEL